MYIFMTEFILNDIVDFFLKFEISLQKQKNYWKQYTWK